MLNICQITINSISGLEEVILLCSIKELSQLLKKYSPNPSYLIVHSDKLHWAPLYLSDPKKDKWHIKSYNLTTITI